MTVTVAVAGASGRMGRALVRALADAPALQLVAAFVRPGHQAIGEDAGRLAGIDTCGVAVTSDEQMAGADFQVLIDFTRPEATLRYADNCAGMGRAMVIGTTGFDSDELVRLRGLVAGIPVVLAPNMSVGVNTCFGLLRAAAGALGDGYDVEIIEAHHRRKVDAPSGTALEMGRIVAAELGRDLDDCALYGRQGITGERDGATIGFATVRGGDIIGEHTVLFAGPGERVEITHRATSRDTFAGGALRAAVWLAGGAPAGLHDMQEVLGLA